MKYLLLIYANEADWSGIPEEEQGRIFEEYMAFSQSIFKSGHYLAGEALQPVATATTVRLKSGKPLTTDGPFAETREQLGGFYMIEAKDLDDAIAVAARIPTRGIGCVEVRPVMETPPVG